MISSERRRTTGPVLDRIGSQSETSQVGLSSAIVADSVGLHNLRAEWTALFALAHEPSLCASHAWATAWWEAFRHEDAGLFVVTVRESGSLIGVVPFFEVRPKSPLGFRQLRALGYLGHESGSDMTEEPTLLARKGSESVVLAQTAKALRPFMNRGRWDAVSLRILHEGPTSPLTALKSGLSVGAFGQPAARNGSDYADLPATWEEYRKSVGKSMRDNLGYYPRLLTRDGHDWSIRFIREPEAMPDAARRLVELHRARSESERGPRHVDHMSGPCQVAFLSGLLTRLAENDQALVAELVVSGEVIASQAFGENGKELMVYYSGFREAWSKYSPIFVIDAAVFKEALERGVERLDFLRGMAPWKARWLARPGPRLHRLTIVSARPTSLIRYAGRFAHTTWRRNVALRFPILKRQAALKLNNLRMNLEKGRNLALPLLPHLHRASLRFAPVVHLATIHHR